MFLSLRKSKLLLDVDRPFKILKRINDNAYIVDILQEYWGSTKVQNLRSNFDKDLVDTQEGIQEDQKENDS
ncbi:hypothetical protein CR513_38141, partial [Mucuna pruriens]